MEGCSGGTLALHLRNDANLPIFLSCLVKSSQDYVFERTSYQWIEYHEWKIAWGIDPGAGWLSMEDSTALIG